MTSHWQSACILASLCCLVVCGTAEVVSQAKLQELRHQAALEARLNAITHESTASKTAVQEEHEYLAELEERLKAQFREFGQELTQSKVTLQQEERNRQEEMEEGFRALMQSMTVSRVEVASLKAQLRGLMAAEATPITELQMAADGFQRDIARLQDDIDRLRRENTTVDVLLERVPAMRLKLKADLRFGGTLDDILAKIALQFGIPMRILAEDLQEEMIPIDRRLELDYKNMTVEQILGDLMLKTNPSPTEALSDPKVKLVYVITNPDAAGRQEILVTTRKRAAERGFLPAAFQANP